jgi:hypothetical protein
LPALIIPLLMIGSAWRRLKNRDGAKIVGRGVGAVVLLLSLPAVLQIVAGSIAWRGTPIAAGGLTGKLIAEFLARYLNNTGAFVLLVGAVLVGVALLLQSTLGDFLGRASVRVREGWQNFRLT